MFIVSCVCATVMHIMLAANDVTRPTPSFPSTLIRAILFLCNSVVVVPRS